LSQQQQQQQQQQQKQQQQLVAVEDATELVEQLQAAQAHGRR
jgi:hypothetical protein